MADPTDLTPEMLAQLEAIHRHLQDDDGTNDGDHVGYVLEALPALIAAAKERDQLRTELEKIRQPIAPSISEGAERLVSGLIAKSRRTPTTRETLARQAPVLAKLAVIERMEREVANLSEQLTESQLARIELSEELDQLRGEICKVRALKS